DDLCYSRSECPTVTIFARKRSEASAKAEGDWKKLEVTVEGPHIVAKLDGKPIPDCSATAKEQLKTGHIGLQNNGGRVEFREIRLLPLTLSPLFAGGSLKGWREVPGSKSKFSVQEKEHTIHISGGPGFLETEKTFKDFVLQLD